MGLHWVLTIILDPKLLQQVTRSESRADTDHVLGSLPFPQNRCGSVSSITVAIAHYYNEQDIDKGEYRSQTG